MANLFRSVKKTHLKRNPFNLSYENNFTTEFGRITPILCQEVVPGDTFKISAQMLVRMAPLFAPAFSRVNVFVRYYFVSHRLLSKYFETFITGGENGDGKIVDRQGNETEATRAYITIATACPKVAAYLQTLGYSANEARARSASLFVHGTLFDYLGFPAYDYNDDMGYTEALRSTEKIDITPFIAYQFIYNENYRDQNFQDEIDLLTDARGNLVDWAAIEGLTNAQIGKLIFDLFSLRICNYEKDYFTSALPFPQRGEDTTIGENDTAVYNTAENYYATVSNGRADIDMQAIATRLRVSGSLVASVNEFRRAIAVQKFKEAMARFGARFTEFLQGIYGTSPTDSRLQRPEFLGGGRVPVMFGEVLQTSETTSNSPQGSYAGRGLAGGQVPNIKARFDEQGWIIGLLTVVPKPFYAQGWPRKFSRFDRFDWMLPQFANIGEQEILQKELCYNFDDQASNGANNALFGYIPRYAEMRYNPNEIHGDFRNSLLDWHTARILEPSTDPQKSMLGSDFLEVQSSQANRIFNYRGSDYDHFWIDLYNEVRVIRPLPKYGTPLI